MSMLLLIAAFICQTLLPSSNSAGVVTGQIRSSDGEPLMGVSVVLVTVEFRHGQASLWAGGTLFHADPVRTNVAGQYRLDNIRPGRYYVLATPSSTSNGDVPT